MSDVTYIGSKARSLELAPEFDKITKIIVICDDNVSYESGNDTGRALTVTIPWGSQKIADDLLERVSGGLYHPYTADGAFVEPAAELGDAVSMRGMYSGIFSQRIRFGRQTLSDISAPFEEEIEHEFPYQSGKDRAIQRRVSGISSSLKILASEISAEVTERKEENKTIKSALSVLPGQISAKVSATQEGTFGWNLNSTSWTLNSGSKTVLKATKDGLEVTGKITATSGSIGGFSINSNYISFNGQTWGGTNSTGIYIGPSGIQLGTAFKVSSAGKITATGGDFTGTIRCDALYVKNASGGYDAITTSTLQSNLSGGAGFNAGGWGGYNAATLSSGAGWGFNFQNAVTRGSAYTPNYFKAAYGDFSSVGVTTQLTAKNLWCSAETFQLGAYGTTIRKMTKTINGVKINYLGY